MYGRPGVGCLNLPKMTALNSQNEVAAKDQMALYSTAWTTGALRTSEMIELRKYLGLGRGKPAWCLKILLCMFLFPECQNAQARLLILKIKISCPVSQNLSSLTSFGSKLNKKRLWNRFFDTPPPEYFTLFVYIYIYKIITYSVFSEAVRPSAKPRASPWKASLFYTVWVANLFVTCTYVHTSILPKSLARSLVTSVHS